MGRGGKKVLRDDPERRCIVTGETGPKAGLIRFAVGPDGQIVPDILGKLPGRGVYVTADRKLVDQAAGKSMFARAAQRQVTVPDDLADLVEKMLVRHVIDLIALARKSGRAVCGYEKVKGWLGGENVKVLLQASDGSERGKGKLWTPEGARWFGILTSDELGLAFGRESVIHCALTAGGLSDRVVEEASKLVGFRSKSDGGSTGKEKKTA